MNLASCYTCAHFGRYLMTMLSVIDHGNNMFDTICSLSALTMHAQRKIIVMNAEWINEENIAMKVIE